MSLNDLEKSQREASLVAGGGEFDLRRYSTEADYL